MKNLLDKFETDYSSVEINQLKNTKKCTEYGWSFTIEIIRYYREESNLPFKSKTVTRKWVTDLDDVRHSDGHTYYSKFTQLK